MVESCQWTISMRTCPWRNLQRRNLGLKDGKRGKGWGRTPRRMFRLGRLSMRGRERFGLGFEPQRPVLEEKANGRDSRGGEGQFRVGKEVRIVGGSGDDLFGSKGKVVDVVGDESVILHLSRREEEVEVRIKDLTELGSAEEEHSFLRKMKDLRIKNDSTGSSKKSGVKRVEMKRVNMFEMAEIRGVTVVELGG